MNRLLILTSLFFASVSCSECSGALYRIYENGLYGFIDSTGNVKIKPQFKYASDFQEGVALVISDVICTDDGYKVTYTYVDAHGKRISETYQMILSSAFSESYLGYDAQFIDCFLNAGLGFQTVAFNALLPSNGLLLYQDDSSGMWGYRDMEGEVRIKPIYNYAAAFSEERAVISTSGLVVGVIDTKGNIIVEPYYVGIRPYANGYTWAFTFDFDLGIAMWLLDKEGRAVQGPYINSKAADFSDNGLAVAEFNLYGYKICTYIKNDGTFLTDFNNNGMLDISERREFFDDAKSFKEGYAPVKINEEWAFINEDCNILSHGYDSTGVFSEGYAKVMFDGLHGKQWGYVDTEFNLVIPYKYTECSAFHNGLAYFRKEDINNTTEGYINKQGTIVWYTTNDN